MGIETDFVVINQNDRTIFKAQSSGAKTWLIKSGRANAVDAVPSVVREGVGVHTFLEALERKGFSCFYENGMPAKRKVEPVTDGNPAVIGCGLIATALLLLPPIYLMNKCSDWSQASEQATRVEDAERSKEYAAKEAEKQAFNDEQKPLWNKPSSTLTEENIAVELNKCYRAINPPSVPEAYLRAQPGNNFNEFERL